VATFGESAENMEVPFRKYGLTLDQIVRAHKVGGYERKPTCLISSVSRGV